MTFFTVSLSKPGTWSKKQGWTAILSTRIRHLHTTLRMNQKYPSVMIYGIWQSVLVFSLDLDNAETLEFSGYSPSSTHVSLRARATHLFALDLENRS
jgi:hypothetical protein